MEFAVSGLRYAYRSGETVSDPSKGCDLTAATIALACAHGVNETVLAKREISRLWEDTSRAPYRALFNSSVTGSRVWVAVELMRWVDQALEAEREKFDGRERLTVVHGNRLLLWAIMNHLHMDHTTVNDFKPPFTKAQVNELVTVATQRLIEIVLDNYPDAYPQPLFKNQSKCRTLGTNLLRWLNGLSAVPEPAHPGILPRLRRPARLHRSRRLRPVRELFPSRLGTPGWAPGNHVSQQRDSILRLAIGPVRTFSAASRARGARRAPCGA